MGDNFTTDLMSILAGVGLFLSIYAFSALKTLMLLPDFEKPLVIKSTIGVLFLAFLPVIASWILAFFFLYKIYIDVGFWAVLIIFVFVVGCVNFVKSRIPFPLTLFTNSAVAPIIIIVFACIILAAILAIPVS